MTTTAMQGALYGGDSHVAPPLIIPSESEIASIRSEYLASLNELKINAKPLINNLTLIAQENEHASVAIIDAIEERIRTASPKEKLYAMYLIDSISKNVRGVYLAEFSRVIARWFINTYEVADPSVQMSMKKLAGTWVDLFPKNVVADVFDYLREREIERREPPRQPDPGYVYSRNSPTPIYNAQEEQRYSQPLPFNPRRHEPVRHRRDPREPRERREPRDLRDMRDRDRDRDLRDARDMRDRRELRDLRREPMPAPLLPQEEYVNYPPALPAHDYIDVRVPGAAYAHEYYDNQPPMLDYDARPPPRGTRPLREFDLPPSSVSASALQQPFINDIPDDPYRNSYNPPPPLPYTIMPSAPIPSLSNAPLIRNIEPLNSAPIWTQPVIGGVSNPTTTFYVSSLNGEPLSNLVLTNESIKKRYAGAVESLYDALPKVCSNCGFRFPDTPKGVSDLRDHLDWHYRKNQRDKERTKKAVFREWFLPAPLWMTLSDTQAVLERPHDPDAMDGPGQTEDSEKTVAPAVHCPAVNDKGKEDPGICEVCGEKFERFFDQESNMWVFKDAVRVNGLTYHASCQEDAAKDAVLAGSKRSASTDSVDESDTKRVKIETETE